MPIRVPYDVPAAVSGPIQYEIGRGMQREQLRREAVAADQARERAALEAAQREADWQRRAAEADAERQWREDLARREQLAKAQQRDMQWQHDMVVASEKEEAETQRQFEIGVAKGDIELDPEDQQEYAKLKADRRHVIDSGRYDEAEQQAFLAKIGARMTEIRTRSRKIEEVPKTYAEAVQRGNIIEAPDGTKFAWDRKRGRMDKIADAPKPQDNPEVKENAAIRKQMMDEYKTEVKLVDGQRKTWIDVNMKHLEQGDKDAARQSTPEEQKNRLATLNERALEMFPDPQKPWLSPEWRVFGGGGAPAVSTPAKPAAKWTRDDIVQYGRSLLASGWSESQVADAIRGILGGQ